MLRNVSGQKWRIFAWDVTTGLPKTGDAANITARITKDHGSPAGTNDANPTEVDATNEPGYYDFDILQAESNAYVASLTPKSSTSNIAAVACPPVLYTTPQYASLLGIESDGDLTKVNTLDGHTAQTGDAYALLNIRANTATAGADGSITLDAGASSTTDFYAGALIRLLAGTGAGQTRFCTAYDGSTKVATVVPNWATNPASGTGFAVLGLGEEGVAAWRRVQPNALVSSRVDSSVGAVAANAITATAIASSAITSDKYASGAITSTVLAVDCIGASQLATDAIGSAEISAAAVTKIQTGLATPTNITAGTITTVSGNVTGSVGSVLGGINTSGGTITTLDGLDTAQDSQHSDTQAAVAAVGAVADAVQAVTDNLPDSGALDDLALAYANTVALVAAVVAAVGTVVDGAPAADGFDTSLSSADNFFNDTVLTFTSGALNGQSRSVTAYAQTSGAVTFDEPFTAAPSNGDAFTILRTHVHPKTQIAAAVLDLDATSHNTNSTLGAIINDWEDAGRLDAILDIVAADVVNLDGAAMRGTDGAFLAASAPTNFSSLVINGAGAVDALVQGFLNNTIAESTTDNIANNFETFFDNGDSATTAIVDDVENVAAAIAGLNNLSAAEVVTALGTYGAIRVIASGTAQDGTSSTIQLAAASAFADEELVGAVIVITGGTGAGQHRAIDTYTGATDTAGVQPDWTTTPDNTSTYEILPGYAAVAFFDTAAKDTVRAQVDNGLAAIHLDHLMASAIPVLGTTVADGSVIAEMASKSATSSWASYDNTTDSLEAAADALATHDAAVAAAISGTNALVGALNNVSAAQVNAEVVDVLRVDTPAELSAVPAAAPSLHEMIQFIYQKLRNQEVVSNTAGTSTLAKDDGSVVGTAALTDDGAVFTKGKYS